MLGSLLVRFSISIVIGKLGTGLSILPKVEGYFGKVGGEKYLGS